MNIADAELEGLVTEGDPEKDFNGLYEIGHGSFGSVYYVSFIPFLLYSYNMLFHIVVQY